MLFASASFASSDTLQHGFGIPVLLDDPKLIRFLLEGEQGGSDSTFSDSTSLSVEGVWELASGTGDDRRMVLLHNGTEVRRLDTIISQKLYRATPEGFSKKGGPESGGRQDPMSAFPTVWSTLKPNPEQWLEWATWPTGFDFSSEATLVRSIAGLGRIRWRLDYLRRVEKVFVGGSLHRSTWYGGLADTLYERSKNDVGFWGWSLTAGVPGFRYEMTLSPWPLPDYLWLEKSITSIVMDSISGEFINLYDNGGIGRTHTGNVSHSFLAQLGWLKYRYTVDSDVYSSGIHDLRLAGLPAGRARWGGGFVLGNGHVVPGLQVEVWPLELGFDKGKKRWKMVPLEVEMWWHEKRHFSFSLRITTHLDDPFPRSFEDKK